MMTTLPQWTAPFIARRRWMKKTFQRFIPELDSIKISDDLTICYALKDIAGPSYDIGYDRVEAFYNYEKEDKVLLLPYLEKGGVFIDIGANIGHFSFFFKEKIKNLECHLFEPNPKLSRCIKTTLEQSNLLDIHIHEVALSNENGEASFFIDSYNDGGHSLLNEKISSKSRSTQEIKVKTIKLDDYFENMGASSITAIKVDIQGAEKFFINGAKETLNKYRPVMMIEVDAHALCDFFNYLEEVLTFDFDIFYGAHKEIYCQDKLKGLEEELALKNQKEANFLIVPRS